MTHLALCWVVSATGTFSNHMNEFGGGFSVDYQNRPNSKRRTRNKPRHTTQKAHFKRDNDRMLPVPQMCWNKVQLAPSQPAFKFTFPILSSS